MSLPRAVRIATWVAGLIPAAALVVLALTDGLGANPIEKVTHVTGEWALRLLLACLGVTPLRRLLGWSWLAPLRRTLGLLAFAYAALHLTTYVALDMFFDLGAIAEDVTRRPYITVGFASFCVLAVLAATSTKAAVKRLGRRWNRLHRAVYLAAIGAVVHFLWLVKADLREPTLYAAVLGLLLGLRLWWAVRARASRARSRRPDSRAAVTLDPRG